MNINNNESHTETHHGVDYCSTTFMAQGREVVNTYQCHQPVFSASDLWRIIRRKKTVGIRTNI